MIRNSERKKVIHCNLMSVFLAAAYNPKAAVVFMHLNPAHILPIMLFGKCVGK